MINFEVKLPKSYYQYADVDLEKYSKGGNGEKLTINLSSYISCKLEQLALDEMRPTQDILKIILVEENVLEENEILLSGRSKASSRFFGVECESLKGIGTHKLYRILMSPYAKAKTIQFMLKNGYDASFFFIKALVKKRAGEDMRFYEILDANKIGL